MKEEKTPWLSALAVEKLLRTRGLVVRYLESAASTNTLLRSLAEDGAAEGTVIIAGEQTAGRGRQGRSFYSPAGTGIYMSLLLRPDMPWERAELITPCAAVAVAGTLERYCGGEAMIKWVNDIYMRGRKVCGILTEAELDQSSGVLRYAVLGIGINVLPPEEGFPAELRAVASSVLEQSGDADLRAKIAAGVLDAFMERYAALEQKSFLAEYRRRSLLPGKRVLITTSGSSEAEEAEAVAIDDDFGLVVRTADGELRTLRSGEASVKA